MAERAWQFMTTAPLNATPIEVQLPSGETMIAHWACDLSGEEQPPFEGWFTWVGSDRHGYYTEIPTPDFWRPIDGTRLANR